MARNVRSGPLEGRTSGGRLPSFRGGMDNGVLRRLLVIKFLRTIPEPERVEEIGSKIAAEETDALLAWAVEGAADLLAQLRFCEPPSSKEALGIWSQKADPVAAFYAEFIVPADGHLLRDSVYNRYRGWAERDEHQDKAKILDKSEFTERFSERVGRDIARLTGGKRGWRGIAFKKGK